MEMITVKCGKCDGKGFLPEYRHIASGTCFACGGKKEFTYTLKAYEKKQEKKRIEVQRKLEIREQNKREYAEKLYKFEAEYKDHPEFKRCMASCPNEDYYEMHLANTMRYMQAKGMTA